MQWCRHYDKVYKSKYEEEAAYNNYMNNVERVKTLNELYKARWVYAHAHWDESGNIHACAIITARRDVKFKINQFADLSGDEFRRYVLMRPRRAPEVNGNIVK